MRNKLTRKGFGGFVKTFIFLSIGMFIGLSFMLSSDSESFTYLNSASRRGTTFIKDKFYVVTNKFTGSGYTNSSTATSGAGLNLLLIAQMNESYAKDLLSLYADFENGNLTDYDYHVHVQGLIGMQVNETGTYDGLLPKTYLPYKNGKVIWNEAYKGVSASGMTLRNFGDKEWNQIHGGLCTWLKEGEYDCYTPWQMTPNNFKTKSKISSPNNANRTKGEHYYIPDNVASLENRMNKFCKDYGLDYTKLNDNAQCSLLSLINNRGEGGVMMVSIGFSYNMSGNRTATKIYKALDDDTKAIATSTLADMYSQYLETHSPDITDYIGSNHGRIIAMAIAAHTDNWYFSSGTADYFKSHNGKNIWHTLYPEEDDMSLDEMVNIIKSKTKNLNVAIKETSGEDLSTSDTKNIYDTASDYSDSSFSWSRRSTIYHVSPNTKIKYDDGKEHTLVGAYDCITAGQSAHATVIGRVIYAMLLKVGGVDVDPTNPTTYLQSVTSQSSQGSDTYIPGTTVTHWYDTYNADTAKMNANRAKILNSCEKYFGIKYDPDANDLKKNTDADYVPSTIDSSTFIWRVYNNAGYKLKTRLKKCSIKKLLNDGNLEEIKVSDMKPGDILISEDAGLAAIYVGYKSGAIGVALSTGAEAPNTSYAKWLSNMSIVSEPDKSATKTYGTVDSTSDVYRVFRYKDIDKDASPYSPSAVGTSSNNNTSTDSTASTSGGKLKHGAKYDKEVTLKSIKNKNADYAYDNAGNKYVKGNKIGNFKITCYCTSCNSPAGSRSTAIGKTATAGISVAMYPGRVPYGTKIIIGDHVYVVEDRYDTGLGRNRVDVFVGTGKYHDSLGAPTGIPVYYAKKAN